MSIFWISVIGSSALAFCLKLFGASVPENWLNHPRVQRINNLIPIALLSALVAVNSLADKTKLVIDNRTAGVAAAIALLIAKAPFPVVVVGAAVTSAVLYRVF
ncbi:MAG: AzlD domain-containing protein [Actinobacteria bacterium]|jgi:branched-subunit amino acid transport protein|nr:AzlD domain-containing protein [Actinomycetota bacterium]